mmetsp:Transcript_29699/g.84710  ORF Transcript_29699/g.84710 Transcript_29699/m.84710 type:complete len:281 (+) Transcript_29699:537-1379(+)
MKRHQAALCCSKRKALTCSAQSFSASPPWSATSCSSRVACSKTAGLCDRAKRIALAASSVSESTTSRTSSKTRRHWKVYRICVAISSSSRFSTRFCCSSVGTLELPTYCADSTDNARLPTIITHSSTMSSSENPGISTRVKRSIKPASQSSPHGTSSKVMFARVPRISTNRSGLSTQLGAIYTSSCIHLAIRAFSLCSSSCILGRTLSWEDTWRTTLQSSGSLVLMTRTTTCGKRPLPTMTSAAKACVARFTTKATRSFPTRGSGKCTTSCSNMIIPSRW